MRAMVDESSLLSLLFQELDWRSWGSITHIGIHCEFPTSVVIRQRKEIPKNMRDLIIIRIASFSIQAFYLELEIITSRKKSFSVKYVDFQTKDY
jgi:hypothetical protein